MTDPGEPLETLLAAARTDFAGRLASKLDELAGLAMREAWGEARRAAHRLRGSAATYGFAEVGAAAAAMEDVLIAAETSPNEKAKRAFAMALASARAEVERLTRAGA